ncbi:hypothetical protein N5E83_20260 [Stutzerimonas stutzeri]|jgi:hypothetical protein|uniref:hypothetical protein n=1 Tax=Stutzerimonas stutzeri TaxID=316 RepID=UPI0024490349|nr:hypothetical protein [Stutzerimonas stutzeri]MDH1543075.1 hypothetical protein [Stutzerimonas stutzeri]
MTAISSNSRLGAALAILGVIVTLSGGVLTWYSSYQATKASVSNSCIQRIDNQEQLIRNKADILLGAIAAFSSGMADPRSSENDFHRLGQDLIDAAMRFTAYAPVELTTQSMKVAATVQVGLMAQTDEEKVKAIGLAKVAMAGWPSAYFDLMDKYEDRRSACF